MRNIFILKTVRRVALFFCLSLLSVSAFGHNEVPLGERGFQQVITGKITSVSDGMPLAGATVTVKGTQTGVVSDFDGNYSIWTCNKNRDKKLSYIFKLH